VPDNTPVEGASASPGGRAPEVTAQVNGAVPAPAVKLCAYAAPTTASGSAAGPTGNAESQMVRSAGGPGATGIAVLSHVDRVLGAVQGATLVIDFEPSGTVVTIAVPYKTVTTGAAA